MELSLRRDLKIPFIAGNSVSQTLSATQIQNLLILSAAIVARHWNGYDLIYYAGYTHPPSPVPRHVPVPFPHICSSHLSISSVSPSPPVPLYLESDTDKDRLWAQFLAHSPSESFKPSSIGSRERPCSNSGGRQWMSLFRLGDFLRRLFKMGE